MLLKRNQGYFCLLFFVISVLAYTKCGPWGGGWVTWAKGGPLGVVGGDDDEAHRGLLGPEGPAGPSDDGVDGKDDDDDDVDDDADDDDDQAHKGLLGPVGLQAPLGLQAQRGPQAPLMMMLLLRA